MSTVQSVFSKAFGESAVTLIELRGVLYFVAQEIGAALGYSAHNFSNSLKEWTQQGELREGVHLHLLAGEDLAGVKQLTPKTAISSHTRALLLLTEPGLYRALMLSGGRNAAAFRDWLDSEVLPSLRETGRYELGGATRRRALDFDRARALPSELRALPAGAVLDLLEAEASAGRPLDELRTALVSNPPPRLGSSPESAGRSATPAARVDVDETELSRFAGLPASWLPTWIVLKRVLHPEEWRRVPRQAIADAVGVDLRTVKRTLDVFEAMGLVSIRRTSGGSYRNVNSLRLGALPEVLVVPEHLLRSRFDA